MIHHIGENMIHHVEGICVPISTSTGTEEVGDLDDADDNTIVINLSDFQFSNT